MAPFHASNLSHQRVGDESCLERNHSLGTRHGWTHNPATHRQYGNSALHKKEGGTRSATLSRIATQILDICHSHKIRLIPSHPPGLGNTKADALSRQKVQDDWHLNPQVAQKICSRLGIPEVDLFASRQTAQTSNYFSLDTRDNDALGVDALAHPWHFQTMYAFPPSALILPVIQKFRSSPGSLILIAQF